jgi:hypothetical protein
MVALCKCHKLMIIIQVHHLVSNFQDFQSFEVEMPHSSMRNVCFFNSLNINMHLHFQ